MIMISNANTIICGHIFKILGKRGFSVYCLIKINSKSVSKNTVLRTYQGRRGVCRP